MAFRVAARTILELGAELISSDGIALYELVKNSVDAGSDHVWIRVQSILRHSTYLFALETLDEGVTPPATVAARIEKAILQNAPDPMRAAFLHAIRSHAKDRSTLRSALTSHYRTTNWIEVEDRGEGMSLDELRDVYLTIGTRSRRKQKPYLSGGSREDNGRTYLGDKGVGRLSAMRLGNLLEVRTSRAGDRRLNLLDIDWTRFDHESDALIEEIDIAPRRGGTKDDPTSSGTVIRIADLRSDWDEDRFRRLLHEDFKRLVDPFDRHLADRLFRLFFNGKQHYVPEIEKRLIDLAHAVVKVDFVQTKNDGARLTGSINYRQHNRQDTIDWNEAEIVSRTNTDSTTVIRTLGPFKVEFYWFNRRILRAVEGLGSKADIQALVRQWSGGLMVFRDGFRINPYGGPEDDWLNLDSRALGSGGYKVNRQQIIGRVLLTWRNRYLEEQTNREGLVENRHKQALVNLLVSLIRERFKGFLDEVDRELRVREVSDLDEIERRIETARSEAERKIRSIARAAPDQAKALAELEGMVRRLTGFVDDARRLVAEYEDDRGKFVHLAGIGLMVEFILHELGRATEGTLSALQGVTREPLGAPVSAAFASLEDQLKTLQKRVQTLDPISTSRRQRKESIDLRELAEQSVEARSEQAERHGVKVAITGAGRAKWRVKAVRGMVIQIFENLFANSFYWLSQQAVVELDFHPEIAIDLDRGNGTISITDNGPGVDPDRAEKIFQPFVTSKPPGEGRGLGLYISRELADYHGWSLYVLPEITSRPGRWNTFVLEIAQ